MSRPAGDGTSRAVWRRWSWLVPALLLAGVVLVSLQCGRFPVPIGEAASVAWAALTGRPAAVPPAEQAIILNVRLPRVLAGILVGASLSVAGAVYQGMFRNPLMSPDILGVSAGAGLGIVLGIFLGWPVMAIQAAAFLGGIAAVAAVYAITSLLPQQDRSLVLVLTGIAVASLLDAGITLLKVLADPYTQLPTITYWLIGSLNGATMADIRAAALPVLLGLAPLWLLRWRVNLLCLDDAEARSLGVPTLALRAGFIAAATLITAAAVAISGAIGWRGLGWVGLIVPHAARLLVGPDFTRLLPASFLLGAGFMVAMDSLARSLTSTGIPLSLLLSAVGVPVFLWLLAKQRRAW